MFVQGQSPSERGRSLKDLLKGEKPEYLIVAEQIDGKRREETKAYLEAEGYEITVFTIPHTGVHWTYVLGGIPSRQILNKRAADIFNAL